MKDMEEKRIGLKGTIQGDTIVFNHDFERKVVSTSESDQFFGSQLNLFDSLIVFQEWCDIRQSPKPMI